MKRRLAYVTVLTAMVVSLLLPGRSILGQSGASDESAGRLPSATSCTELITNTSFETQEGWQRGLTPRTAQYVSDTSQHGSWSMLLGVRSPTTDTYCHSSAYQLVHVPADATWVRLGFWYKPFSEESPWQKAKDVTWEGYAPAREEGSSKQAGSLSEAELESGLWNAYDWQEALILNSSYGLLEVVMRQRSNSGTWGYWSHDLSAYRGQDIVIYFNVFNNGWGGRTRMYIDDVSVLSCDDALARTPTPTPTSTPWDCVDPIQNGSFESQTGWQRGITPRTARYTGDASHAGASSMLLGVRSGETDVLSHSSAYQKIHVPQSAQSARLSFWFKPFTEESTYGVLGDVDWEGYEVAVSSEGPQPSAETPEFRDANDWQAYDWQECLILDAGYDLVATVMRRSSNTQSWQYMTADLMPYRGQDIVIYFNVYNNGSGGRRTSMYVDEVSVSVCSPPATVTPTPVPTSTPKPCAEIISNGSFEGVTGWSIGLTPRQAMYVTDTAYSGARSTLLGIRPPTTDIYSYSSVRQSVYVPPDTTSATLTFRYKPFTEERTVVSAEEVDWAGYDTRGNVEGESLDEASRVDSGSWSYYDWQECLILDPSYRVLGVVMRTCSDAQSWQYWTYDLSAYRGQHIVLYFNVYNDGVGGLRTWMYLDDVSVEACGQSYRTFFLPLLSKYWPTVPPVTPTPPTYPYPAS